MFLKANVSARVAIKAGFHSKIVEVIHIPTHLYFSPSSLDFVATSITLPTLPSSPQPRKVTNTDHPATLREET